MARAGQDVQFGVGDAPLQAASVGRPFQQVEFANDDAGRGGDLAQPGGEVDGQEAIAQADDGA